MRRHAFGLCTIVLIALLSVSGRKQSKVTPKHDYPVQPVPFTAVHLNDVFWAPRIETNRTATIPFAFEQCELTGRVETSSGRRKALRARRSRTAIRQAIPFDDTDSTK